MPPIVKQEDLRRAENGNVQGTLVVEWSELRFRHPEPFDYKGEVQLLNQTIGRVNVQIRMFEEDFNKSCVRGRLEAQVAGFAVRNELEKTCEEVP